MPGLFLFSWDQDGDACGYGVDLRKVSLVHSQAESAPRVDVEQRFSDGDVAEGLDEWELVQLANQVSGTLSPTT